MSLQYALWIFYSHKAFFNGYDEGEAVYYAAMNSYKRSFENPWIPDNEPVPYLIQRLTRNKKNTMMRS